MKRISYLVSRALLIAVVPAAGCAVDSAPQGLRRTPEGSGPTVVFDLHRRPLPEIPAPNDVATFPDPTSRTGRRINASQVAPTDMERVARGQFDEMEGWGTFSPMTVSFARGAGADALDAAIELDDVKARMGGSDWDLSNDPVYVVNLTTGVPALLDMGNGNFPVSVLYPAVYYPNDPRVDENNLVFESAEEGAGLSQASYRPALDTDFDGVLDHPNTLGPSARYPGIDNLLTWYERETDTLIMRPLLPLEEKTEYAVVLTDRLHGKGGVVRSPFPYIHHPTQARGVARLGEILRDKGRAAYYGDLAGTGLDHVAFAWTFTTQPVAEDMRLLRDGLYGKGPFARFAADFPTKIRALPTAGKSLAAEDEPPGWASLPECASPAKTPFVVRWADAKGALGPFLEHVFPVSKTALAALEASLDDVDYFVIGDYESPFLAGDPKSPDTDQHFHANFITGEADVHRDRVHFWLSVPKARGDRRPPFPVAYWEHGTTLYDTEMFLHAGKYAKQGIALASIDAPGHGMHLDPGQRFLAQALLAGACLGPFTDALDSGRAIDLNGDGIRDSGGLVWSAHILHTRDGVRQAALDLMQLTRILKSFDGVARSDQDFNDDGAPDLAGDFNGDGVVDVGGPGGRFFASGGSLGGIISQIVGAVDPNITASAPVAGGGGFSDIALRGKVTPVPVLEQTFGPIIVAVPASSRAGSTQCQGDQRSVRWVINDLFASKELEIACLSAAELDVGKTVIVTNVTTKTRRCARTLDGGGFRVPIPTSIGDAIDVQIYDAPDVVRSYKGCEVVAGAPVGRRIKTWEQAATSFGSVATPGLTCDAPEGCQQFRQSFYTVGSPLVAPQEGIGLYRQTPDFRKLMLLSQAALDPADPINFAPYYMLRPLPGIDGAPMPPRPLLNVDTVGDDQVTTATGLAFARAAGALPFLPPSAVTTMPEYADYATPRALYDAWGGRTPNQVLIDGAEIESLSRLGRTPVASCAANYTPSAACQSPPTADTWTCAHTLYDADWLGETAQTYGQPHPPMPLRLARVAGARVTDGSSLDAAWTPRLRGVPFAADGAWGGDAPVVAVINAYLAPLGQHDWSTGEPCQAWDGVTYMDHLLARFFASSGRDLYYLTHPKSHACLATASCAFFE